MRKLFFILLLSSCAFAQMGTKIFDPLSSPTCSPSGTTCPAPRGFNWHYVYDPVNGEVLLLESDPNDPSIYSGAIWAYSTVTHGFTVRATNGNTAGDGVNNCGGWSTAGQNLNPQEGHPLGFFAFDTFRSKAYATGGLCNTKTNGTTSSYNATTRSMDAVILAGQFSSCSGGWNCGGPAWSSGMTFVGGSFNKSVTCCQNAGGGFFVSEFNGSTYTDITASIAASPRPPLTATGMVSDGTYLWFFGGCNGAAPGNGTGADSCGSSGGTASNDLYKYDPVAKTFTLMSPVGGVKPSATWANFPMVVYDSRRSRLVFYDPGNKLLWQYVIATNTWSQITYSGVLPDQSTWDSTQSAIIAAGTANGAAYDSANDKMVLIYSVSQSQSIGLYELNFGGGASSTYANLTVQESLFTGGYAGATRTTPSFCQGVALPDNTLNSTSGLTLSNASAGQFRVLGSWPSGYYKWVEVCGVLSSNISAGGTASVALQSGGGGNFGGSNLATDNGTTITVATGTATFTVKKANFNGLDIVDVGTTHLVLTGTSPGFQLYGPDPTATYPGNVTCSPTTGGTACTTVFSSRYDSGSTCSVEKNGPVATTLLCTWTYKDSGGTHSYMNGTARLYFFKNQSDVYIKPILRNADYGAGAVFATAYKGISGYDFGVTLNLTSGNISIGNHTTTPTTGALSGTDDFIINQGYNSTMQAEEQPTTFWSGTNGYTITKNGATTGLTGTTSGTQTQTPDGWADLDSSGNGLQIGTFWFGQEGAKSLRYTGATTTVTAKVGILSPQNDKPFYIEYPAWLIESPRGFWLNFHTSTVSAPSTAFNNWESFLVARQPISEYNAAGVFDYPILTPSAQDTYETSNYAAATPATIPSGFRWSTANVTNNTDTACPGTNACPNVTRRYSWQLENDYRWDYMMTWLQRGWAARYLEAMSFYNYTAEYAAAHSDGFNWRDHWDASFTEVDGFGQPKVTSNGNNANATLGIHGAGVFGYTNWHDQEHNHWWGMSDYYFLSGDDTIKDALIDEQKDWYLSSHTYQDGGNPASETVTLVSGNSTITRTCCSSWTATVVGQVLLIGTPPNYTPYKVVSLTDGTHVVVSPTPSSSLSNQPMVWGSGLYNSRALASNLLNGVYFARFLDAIGDSESAGVKTQLQHIYDVMVKSDICANGYPSGCSIGTDLEHAAGLSGVHPKRGFVWGNQGQSGNWCAYGHTYRVNSAFQSALVVEGVMALRKLLGSSWADYWEASDRAYAIAKFAQNELFIDDGSGRWDYNGFRFGFTPDSPNNCQGASDLFTVSTDGTTAVTNISPKSFAPICVGASVPCSGSSLNPTLSATPHIIPLVVINGQRYQIASVTDANHLTLTTSAPANASQNMYIEEVDFVTPISSYNYPLVFWADWLTTGSTAWSNKLSMSMQQIQGVSGRAARNFMGHEWATAVNTLNNPGTKTLQTIPISSFTDNGNGTYSIGWTTPAGTDYLRVKYGCAYKLCQGGTHGPIVDWIGFDPGTNTFTGTASNTAWFAAIDATSIPSPVAGSQSMTVTTGQSGMSINEFSVKAFTSGISSGPGSSGSLMNGRVKLSGKVVVH